MDKKYTSLNSSKILSSDDNNIISKLRRLRIQEALLLQSLHKSDRNLKDVDLFNHSSYTELLKKVKDSYINLKNLYDEVKTNTQSQALLAELDIDELKNKIFEMETNIKTFKFDINSELATLQLAEQDLLMKQIVEIPIEVENIKRLPKAISISYNAIIPSPVKVLMTCPFKCSEVQDFQEFMKNSSNRHGGWNEYNHNLFVKYWQKFFGKSYSTEFEDENIQQSILYKMFVEAAMPKLQDIAASDISSHVKWYVQYLFHKEKQQHAIDKWKWKKVTAKKVPEKVMCAEEKYSFPETITDNHTFIACNFKANRHALPERAPKNIIKSKSLVSKSKLTKQTDRTQNILKPTKQWLNRHDNANRDIESSSAFQCIESMEKQLRTPYWRLGL